MLSNSHHTKVVGAGMNFYDHYMFTFYNLDEYSTFNINFLDLSVSDFLYREICKYLYEIYGMEKKYHTHMFNKFGSELKKRDERKLFQ